MACPRRARGRQHGPGRTGAGLPGGCGVRRGRRAVFDEVIVSASATQAAYGEAGPDLFASSAGRPSAPSEVRRADGHAGPLGPVYQAGTSRGTHRHGHGLAARPARRRPLRQLGRRAVRLADGFRLRSAGGCRSRAVVGRWSGAAPRSTTTPPATDEKACARFFRPPEGVALAPNLRVAFPAWPRRLHPRRGHRRRHPRGDQT